MQCRIDYVRFVWQLLPPVLRSSVLLVLLRVLITPLRYLQERLSAYMEGVSSRLNITANVQYIQKALNDAFYLTDNQIYIETPEAERATVFYYQEEGQAANYINTKGGDAFYLRTPDDVSPNETYIVYVPSFLCTSIDAEGDEFHGEHLQTIYNLLNTYKPAGRKYRIEIYDYE